MRERPQTLGAIIHTAATRMDVPHTEAMIRQMHFDRGWSDIGYNCYIRLDGRPCIGRHPDQVGAHAKGVNFTHIGICLEGGLDPDGKPIENYHPAAQLDGLEAAIHWYRRVYPLIGNNIRGHRDLSPDLDGDGIIEPHEWIKLCPLMDVQQFLTDRGLLI